MRLLLFLLLLLPFAACEKQVEKAQEEVGLDIMTNGQWRVTSFMEGTTDRTADFSPYKFQFKNDRTVDAIVGTSVQKTGTWQADVTARTITSNFAGSAAPLSLLNGTFTITDSSPTYVKAQQTINGILHTLRLDKI